MDSHEAVRDHDNEGEDFEMPKQVDILNSINQQSKGT